jgi:hypothetical protein
MLSFIIVVDSRRRIWKAGRLTKRMKKVSGDSLLNREEPEGRQSVVEFSSMSNLSPAVFPGLNKLCLQR